MKKRYLIILLIFLSILSIFIGVKEIRITDILALDDEKIKIILVSRIPRLVSILAAGFSMSIGGLIMQQLTRNRFVSPTTAATVDSARLGILFSLIFFPASSSILKMIISFAFALSGTMIFLKIMKNIKIKNKIFIPLVGIMLGNIIDSITTFFAYRFDLVQNISSWLQGDFSMVIKGRYELLYLSIPLIALAYIYSSKFTVAGLGEDFSSNLGLDYNLIVNIGISIVAMSTAIVVITVGRMPFLGLIIPNIITLYFGDNLRKNLLPTGLLGAAFLVFCDILGRIIIYPYEISIGLTVGVIGSALFLYLLLRGDK